MVASIAPSAALTTNATSGNSAVVLDAQIERYKKELADCVNCDSASTPQGKATIAEIVEKINAARESLEKAAQAKSERPDAAATSAPAPANPTMLGHRLDEFA